MTYHWPGLLLLTLVAAGCPGKQGSDTDITSDASTLAVTDTNADTRTGTTGTSTDPTTTTEPTGTTGTTGEPTGTTGEPTGTTGEPPPECACIDRDQFGAESYTCPIDGGCGPVEAFCDAVIDEMDVACAGWGAFSVDPVVLDCALDRLIAGTPGLVWWHIGSNGPGDWGGFVDIIGDRMGIARNYEYFDLGGSDTPAGMVTLKDAAYFEGCKAEADPELKFLCMRDWWTAPPTELCDVLSHISDD